MDRLVDAGPFINGFPIEGVGVEIGGHPTLLLISFGCGIRYHAVLSER